MTKNVVVIGGGIAGMESSACLSVMGYSVTLLEKEDKLGGHLLERKILFPTRRAGRDVIDFLNRNIEYGKVNVMLGVEINQIERISETPPKFRLHLRNNKTLNADAIIIATGYDIFDARKKEEYGYGIYDNVITSADLEKIFLNESEIKTSYGKVPKRIGFVHCVGSRDEKVGNHYCSRICCITGVKQAIELREKLPNCEVFCFYMDLRMCGRYYEELYRESQEKYGVNFIRGRVSEAAENQDGSIVVKVEDTLSGRPLKMKVDLLVLLVGFVPSEGTRKIGKMLGMKFGDDFFLKTEDEHIMTYGSNIPGIFLAGTCTGPKCVMSTITDARATALKVASFLEGYNTG